MLQMQINVVIVAYICDLHNMDIQHLNVAPV